MPRKEQIAKAFFLYSLRSGRGQGLISRITDPIESFLQASVYLFALRGLGFDVPLYIVFILIPFVFICRYIIGWIDEKKLGLWKMENHYVAGELNTWNQNLMYKVDALRQRIEEIEYDRISRK